MRDINILINEDHTVSFDNDYAGLNRENLQGNIVFNFKNFVDGEARAEVIVDNQEGYILLNKVGQTYTMPILSSLLTGDFIIMQLVITQPTIDESIPVWKSETFTLKVGFSINADSTIPEEYPSWIDKLEEMASEVDEAIEKAGKVNISSEQLTDGVKVITTNQDGEETITIVPQGPQGEPGVPGAVKTIVVNVLPTENIDTSAIYLVPSSTPETSNTYDEYMYINNNWEKLGGNLVIDLSNYVQFTDYATDSKGGVIKVDAGYGSEIASSGGLRGSARTYSQYSASNERLIISKGTLENVITGKGLVSNTNYATAQTGGVIKQASGFLVNNNGEPYAQVISSEYYPQLSQYAFIGKGTLENVLTAKIGDINTAIDSINGEVI
jgi:hypothetical protein